MGVRLVPVVLNLLLALHQACACGGVNFTHDVCMPVCMWATGAVYMNHIIGV